MLIFIQINIRNRFELIRAISQIISPLFIFDLPLYIINILYLNRVI